MPNLQTQFDPDRVRRIVTDLHRLAAETIDATGGRLSESVGILHAAADLERLIDPQAAAFVRLPEREGRSPI